MTLLRGYIVMSVLRGVGLALAVLVAVMTGFDLVAQLKDVNVGSYDLSSAIFYVVLGTPRTVFSVLPAAALIGSLLALCSSKCCQAPANEWSCSAVVTK
jgi:lipopolysaccharide export system permease protein